MDTRELLLTNINNSVHINITNVENINNISSNNTIVQKIKYGFISIFKLLIFLIMSVYPFIEIGYSTKYIDIQCDTSMFISISKWMFIHGIIGIILFASFSASITGSYDQINTYRYISCGINDIKLFFTIILLSNICWIFIGLIIYLYGCSDINQNIFDYFMKITLVLVFLILTHMIITKCKYVL
jgi:hypothetical protein